MRTIALVGAGNIGSRHLQALKNVKLPLSIYVVDPNKSSLRIAKERYEQFNSTTKDSQQLEFLESVDNVPSKIDLAIIATNSGIRRKVIESLFKKSQVKNLVLEKLLFPKKEDYSYISKLLKSRRTKAFVNCSMRTMPFYQKLKNNIKGSRINYIVSGSQYGLITNAIHYIDHMAYLLDSPDFTVNTGMLDKKPVKSRREGYLELNGTLNIFFKNGSSGSISCFSNGDTPIIVEIHSDKFRCISKESERKAYISKASDNWEFKEVITNIPYQSQMTDKIVEDIISKGNCRLVSYEESAKIHLTLLESLLKFLNENSSKKYKIYPFT